MESSGSTNGHASHGTIRLHHDAWGRLVLTDAAGREHVGVDPVRAFPISDPHHGISILDAEGRELLWLDHLEELPGPVRRVLEEELARRQFMPVIRRVLRVSAPVEPSEWEVETDRGPTRFLLDSEDDFHRLDEHRALVQDAQGIRYLIPDTRSLDPASRRLLERYL
jgi:Domain of unknown function (DUF1854)